MRENGKMKNKWAALTFLALSVSLIVIDGTIVNVAIPVIMKELNFKFTEAEWITTIYALVFSALLITTGRIADHIGRKKTLIVGIAIFMAGSIFASMSTSVGMILLARVFQGVGGAVVLPTTLSAVNSTFFGKDRIVAFAVWGSVIAGMAALGPLLGGYLTTYFNWSWIFWINLPIGIIILIGTIIFVPETYGEPLEGSFDFVGFLLSSVGLAALVYGLIEGRSYGWLHSKKGGEVFGLSRIPFIIVGALILLILFVVIEKSRIKKGKTYLLDISLFGIKSFTLGNIIACIVAIGEFGLLFVLPLYLQNVLAMTAMEAGKILAFMGLGAFISGGLASGIAKRTSPRTVASMGLFLESAGMFGFFLTIKPDIPTGVMVLWLLIYGAGLGMASAQITSTVLRDVPTEKSGQGSATQSTVRQMGSALGVAIVGTILATFLSANVAGVLDDFHMPPKMQKGIEQSVVESAGASINSLRGDSQAVKHMPSEARKEISIVLTDKFTTSATDTIGIAAALVFVGFILTLFLPAHPKKKK